MSFTEANLPSIDVNQLRNLSKYTRLDNEEEIHTGSERTLADSLLPSVGRMPLLRQVLSSQFQHLYIPAYYPYQY